MATPIAYGRMGGIFLTGCVDACIQRRKFDGRPFAEFGVLPLKMMESFGTKIHFSGFEKVRALDFPVVWVANHMSPLETYIIPPAVMTFSPVAIVLKSSLVHYPVFGRIVRTIHTIRLGRKNAMEDLRSMLEQGVQMLRDGRSVLVFPEGRRSLTFNPANFNSIGVKLAQRANVAVVPIAVRTDAMQIGTKLKDIFTIHSERPVHIECGTPILPGRDPRDALQEIRDFLSERLTTWQTQFDSGTPLLLPPSSTTEP